MYTTIAMGSSSREDARGACYKEGISNSLFDVIEAAVLKRYPKVGLYVGFGVNVMTQHFLHRSGR
jgi:hypothetical protein